MTQSHAFFCGSGKADITAEIKGLTMLGYGNPQNNIQGVEDPLFARAMYLHNEHDHFVFLNLEVGFITDALRQSIVKKIQGISPLDADNIHISAQHTHSAAGGFTHYAMYNMPTPGHSPKVLETYANGALHAFEKAKQNLKKGELFYGEDHFSFSENVAFNRSLDAFLNNPDINDFSLGRDKHSAVNRKMQVLYFVDEDKNISSSINWFGVHATNIPNTNTLISSDNKGHAARLVEQKRSGHISLFNQADAGDISPNWIWDSKLKRNRADSDDYFYAAYENGRYQGQKLLSILDKKHLKLNNTLKSKIWYFDFSNIRPDLEFLPKDAHKDAATTPAAHGASFIQGTLEGPGIPAPLATLLGCIASLVSFKNRIFSKKERLYYKNQAPKKIVLEPGKKRILGFKNLNILWPIALFDPMIRTLIRQYNKGALKEHSWTQQVLPIQLTQIGDKLVVSLPMETSTMAGMRIKKYILDRTNKFGICDIISSPYSNGYAGYLVTPEEYDAQAYEGGHCVFGKYSLPATLSLIKKCLDHFYENKDCVENTSPIHFSKQELSKRLYPH